MQDLTSSFSFQSGLCPQTVYEHDIAFSDIFRCLVGLNVGLPESERKPADSDGWFCESTWKLFANELH